MSSKRRGKMEEYSPYELVDMAVSTLEQAIDRLLSSNNIDISKKLQFASRANMGISVIREALRELRR